MSDALDRLGERLADRANPLMVKEVRQGLRARTFWLFFALMLVVNLFISLVGWQEAHEGAQNVGQWVFLAFFVVLAVVQFFVLPYSAYRSMLREAENETWVLLTLTGLGPRRILGGKVMSASLQGVLYASAAAPFLLFSYFLNGIGLPTVIATVVVALGYQVLLVSLAISVATLASTRLMRGLLHFLLLGGLFQALSLGIGGGMAVESVLARSFVGLDFWLATGGLLFAAVSTGVLLFEAAAARLSLPTEDYARGPRLAYVVQFLGGVVFAVLAWMRGESTLPVAGVALALYATMVGIFVVSDRDGSSRAQWAAGPRYSLLRPGGLRGYVLVVVLLVGVLAAFAALSIADDEGLLRLLAALTYALLLLSVPVVLTRQLSHPPAQTPALTRVVFFTLLVALTAIPPMVGEIVSEASDVRLNAFNPIVGFANLDEPGGPLALLVATAVAGLFVALALGALRRRDVEWRA